MTLLTLDVHLFCRDPVALLGFYAALFDAAEDEAARSPTHCALRIGTAELGFTRTDSAALLGLAACLPGDDGIRAFATFEMTEEHEVGRLAARAVELGGRVVSAPHRTWYCSWQLVAADPEGNLFRVDHRG
jgi:predicted enzyme related to lactoylglutathione lyase